jgi:Sec63 Brl domain
MPPYSSPHKHRVGVLVKPNSQFLTTTAAAAIAAQTVHTLHCTLLCTQAHFYRKPLPISDYTNDTKSVLDQAPRVLNAMIDISAHLGLLDQTLQLMHIAQCIAQALPPDADPLLQVLTVAAARRLRTALRNTSSSSSSSSVNNDSDDSAGTLRELLARGPQQCERLILQALQQQQQQQQRRSQGDAASKVLQTVAGFPLINLQAELVPVLSTASANDAAAASGVPQLVENVEHSMKVRLLLAPHIGKVCN